MADNFENEMLEDILANTEKALKEDCYGNIQNHSEDALKFVALNLNNLIMLEDYEYDSMFLEPPVIEYSNRNQHYTGEELNTLALLAISEICKVQLLQKQGISILQFNDVLIEEMTTHLALINY